MSDAAKRGLLIFLVGLAILVAGLVYQHLRLGADSPLATVAVSSTIGASVGGPFALTDQNGGIRRSQDFAGKLMLIYFGYTYCPDVCPTELQTMSEAVDLLGDQGAAVQPIFISVDPQRDTVEQIKSYAENFHPRLVALTGQDADIAAVARAYRVFFKPVKQAGGEAYTVDHSSIVYLMGRDGAYLAHFGPNTDAAEMAAAIKKRL